MVPECAAISPDHAGRLAQRHATGFQGARSNMTRGREAERAYKLATVLVAQGRSRAALAAYDHALELQPSHVAAQTGLADLLAGRDPLDRLSSGAFVSRSPALSSRGFWRAGAAKAGL